MATATNPTVDELEKKEEELFRTGPLSVLTTSVKSNSQVRAALLALLNIRLHLLRHLGLLEHFDSLSSFSDPHQT